MKKIIFVLTSILIAVYIAFSILGAGGEYAAEKLFYRAIKIIGKISANPDVAPPVLVNSAENGLKLVIKKYPGSNIAKAAYLTLAQFYAGRKKYDSAISTLNEMINLKINDEIILSKAHFLKGNVYEKSGKWDSALKEYRILEDKYTYTELGIQIPLYIGNYYLSNEKEEAADKAFNEAVVFYQKIRDEKKKTIVGYVASNLLTQTYFNLKRFEDAGKIVEDTIVDYSSEQVYAQCLPSVELIFVKNLDKKDKAIEIYNGIKEKTKNNKLKKLLEDKIKALKAKK